MGTDKLLVTCSWLKISGGTWGFTRLFPLPVCTFEIIYNKKRGLGCSSVVECLSSKLWV
jgi:hypothetical protein